ncbi:hypothetical protein GALMADRAFT_217701 [Galerina marginata CBS 339.88]|uniref:Uncharacterized protein n=1 Tax=Galerina marginata (strain CBS 339.88) TaxID=685588 RepID=A0A067S2P4_GALM3|nr:hypothetical protein GALMADRAFT_217701 [Galerina marginata CBS 339.88]
MSAYGQCAKARSVEKIPTYWEIANDPEFNFFLEESEEPHNIVTVFRYFLNDKHHIPAFGSLTLYQLLADYSQDGVLSKPTAEEMATILKLIGKGGLNGLKALGFTCSSHPRIVAALKVVDERLRGRLSSRLVQLINLDFLFIEHGLCKLCRGDTDENYKIYDLVKGS